MAQLSARQTAVAALEIWRDNARFADSIISKLLAKSALSDSDRAFALQLFYGVLRNLSLLDFWIGCLRPTAIDVDLRDLLRLGLYQLFCLKTPEHAAVNETVELARKGGRAVINGMLRAAVRQRENLRSRASAQPLSIRTSHPEFLIARWERHFGAKAAEALSAWNNEPPPVYGRINQLKIGREEFHRLYPNSKPILGNSDFVAFNVFPTSALHEGHCYIQDPSTAIPCQLLDPQSGEKILDGCAAPGGKRAFVTQLMKNRGLIMACDREAERISILDENVARLGVEIVRSFRCNWEQDRIPQEIASVAPFDRILIDAPCSNTGVMRRRVDVRWRLQPSDFVHMQTRQLEIIRAVFPLLKPGGALIYSTCSLEPEENEDVVRYALTEMPIFQLEEEKQSLPFRDAFDGAFAAKLVRTV